MFSYFKSYSGRLGKLQFEESATREDLLGAEESQTKGFFFKPSLKSKATVFSVGSRDEVLSSELEVSQSSCLPPHSLPGRVRSSCRTPSRGQTSATLTRCSSAPSSSPCWTTPAGSSFSYRSSLSWMQHPLRRYSTAYLVRYLPFLVDVYARSRRRQDDVTTAQADGFHSV